MKTEPNIEIGVLYAETIHFRLSGKFTIEGTSQTALGDARATIENNQIVIHQNDSAKWNAKEFVFLPCNFSSDHFDLHEVVIGVNFHWEQKEDQRFRGALKLIIENNKIHAINILPVENYLISVISSEMSADSSLSLLKAHAVISRSWLLAQIDKQNGLQTEGTQYKSIHQSSTEYIRWYDREDHSLFHVCADDHCQRYQGITRAHNPNVIKAVQETSGEVLLYDGRICDARFSKCCGGVTEVFENCWEPVNHPYLQAFADNTENPAGFDLKLSVEQNAAIFINAEPDAFCNTRDEKVLSQVLNHYDRSSSDFYRWEKSYSQEEISALIKKRSGFDFGRIKALNPVQRGTSGRLTKLEIVGEKMTLSVGKELEIRRWLSESHLYSSAFNISVQGNVDGFPESFSLRGAGWGHGVGLCQIGAAVMGEKGYNYQQILTHYFRGAGLEKMY